MSSVYAYDLSSIPRTPGLDAMVCIYNPSTPMMRWKVEENMVELHCPPEVQLHMCCVHLHTGTQRKSPTAVLAFLPLLSSPTQSPQLLYCFSFLTLWTAEHFWRPGWRESPANTLLLLQLL